MYMCVYIYIYQYKYHYIYHYMCIYITVVLIFAVLTFKGLTSKFYKYTCKNPSKVKIAKNIHNSRHLHNQLFIENFQELSVSFSFIADI